MSDFLGFKKRAAVKQRKVDDIAADEARLQRLLDMVYDNDSPTGNDASWEGWTEIEELKKTLGG